VLANQQPTICFIDFGNITQVAIADIRKIPYELVQLPVHTASCHIKGLPDDMEEILPQLETVFVAGVDILADSVENEEKLVHGLKQTCAILTINSLNL
jgi:Tudor domain